jgi:predicted GIY-YIG superfamily endonuclease
MPLIYVLKCQQGKYYVGKTEKSINKRYKEHISGKGAEWTRRYKPKYIKETKKGDNFDEDKVTKEYMTKYGIENVRGGVYCKLILDNISLQALNREIFGACNKCIKCGKLGHYIKNCKFTNEPKYTRSNKYRNMESSEEDYSTDDDDEEYYYESNNRGICYRCGRKGHYSNKCYASIHVKGYYLN